MDGGDITRANNTRSKLGNEYTNRIEDQARASVLVDGLGFRLEDADAAAVEPILTLVAANVKLRFVVRLLTQTIELLRVARFVAAVAHKLAHRLTHGFRDANAAAMEPIGAQIAAHVKLGVVVGRPADTVQLLLVAAFTSAARCRPLFFGRRGIGTRTDDFFRFCRLLLSLLAAR